MIVRKKKFNEAQYHEVLEGYAEAIKDMLWGLPMAKKDLSLREPFDIGYLHALDEAKDRIKLIKKGYAPK